MVASTRQTVIRNTLFSYGRTLVSAALTLFASRWVLADLGASDLGIYGLAGGLLFFVSFISSILSQGTSRYLAYAIGSGSAENVTAWFNTALNVFFCLPIILLPLGIGIGEVMVRFVLNIEASRVYAALWVLRCSLISFFMVLLATPFLSLLTSKQLIHVAASLMLIHSIGLFVIAWLLPKFGGDHLIVYAALVAGSLILLQIMYVLVCRKLCPEARIRFCYWWNWQRIKALASYSGWLCIGTVGTVLNVQGQGLLLNWMRGTSANAGAGVASSLGGQMQTLANAFLQAISPEVIRREGANNHKLMVQLARRASKFGMMLLLFVALPLFWECDYVLKLWLKTPPPYSMFFTRLTILSALFYKMAVGHRMCFQAIGRIRGQQLVELFTFAGMVPVIAIAYLISHSVMVSFSFVVVMQFIYFLVTAVVGSRLFEWPVREAVHEIFAHACMCFIGGGLIFWGIQMLLSDDSFIRLLIVVILLVIYVIVYFCTVVFKAEERTLLINGINNLKNRLFRR